MSFSSKQSPEKNESLITQSPTAYKQATPQKLESKNLRFSMDIVDTDQILSLVSKIQTFATDVDMETEQRQKFSSFISNYKKIIQKFNIIIVDPKEIFEDFWNNWNKLADLIDEVLPADNFKNVVVFSSEQLQRSKNCFSKAEAKLEKLKPKAKSKFEYVNELLEDLISFTFSVKKPSSMKRFYSALTECNSAISTYINPYFKRISKIQDQKELQKMDQNLTASFQYYKSATTFFHQVIQMVKTYNESGRKREEFISNVETCGRELSLLVPKPLKKLTISELQQQYQIDTRQEPKKKKKKQTSPNTSTSSSKDNSQHSPSSYQKKTITKPTVSPLPLLKRDREKLLDQASIQITPKGLRSKPASKMHKEKVIYNSPHTKQLPPPKDSDSDDFNTSDVDQIFDESPPQKSQKKQQNFSDESEESENEND